MEPFAPRLKAEPIVTPVDVHAHGHFVVVGEQSLGRGKPRLVDVVPVSREHAKALAARRLVFDRLVALGRPEDPVRGMNWVPRGRLRLLTSSEQVKALRIRLGHVLVDSPFPRGEWTALHGPSLLAVLGQLAQKASRRQSRMRF